MYEIHISTTFRASRERVFDAVSDHEKLLRGPNIDRCEVTTAGKDERNGLGAVREVFGGGHHFVEEVVRFDRPTRYDYVVRRVTKDGKPLPMKHELGWLELSESSGVTTVDWHSRFAITIPLLGWVIERVQGPKFAAAFSELLEQLRPQLESDAASESAA